MLDGNNERPDVHEQYDVACSQGGARNVVGAAGMALNPDGQEEPIPGSLRAGMALLRLHSEWTGAAKPTRLGPAQVAALAVRYRDKHGIPNRPKAQAEAARWYANELTLLALSLKSRPVVWAQLLPWAQAKGISDGQVAQALLHWLSPTCERCDGHGLLKAPDAPALSAKQCRACNGTGTKMVPEGGGLVLGHISYCVSQARQSIQKRLRAKG